MPAKNIVIGQRVSSALVRRANELRRKMTPAEQALWQELRRSQLTGIHFRRQQVIEGFIVDFYCHAAGLVIEVDGGVHDNLAEYDHERTELLSACGLRVIRFTNDEVLGDIHWVLARIREEVKTKSPTP